MISQSPSIHLNVCTVLPSEAKVYLFLQWNLFFFPQANKCTNALHSSKLTYLSLSPSLSLFLSLSFPTIMMGTFYFILFAICFSENDGDHKVQGCTDMWADGTRTSCSHTTPQAQNHMCHQSPIAKARWRIEMWWSKMFHFISNV